MKISAGSTISTRIDTSMYSTKPMPSFPPTYQVFFHQVQIDGRYAIIVKIHLLTCLHLRMKSQSCSQRTCFPDLTLPACPGCASFAVAQVQSGCETATTPTQAAGSYSPARGNT